MMDIWKRIALAAIRRQVRERKHHEHTRMPFEQRDITWGDVEAKLWTAAMRAREQSETLIKVAIRKKVPHEH